jgi:chromosome partitioning protein
MGVYMTKTIIVAAIIMEKGGVGKTTVALNLAVAALQNGRNAAIIDIDPQATASNWTDRRTDQKPWVVPTLTARLGPAIEHAKSQGIDFIVIDTPPHSGSDAAEAGRRADVVLVPVEPHLFTLETLPKLGDLLKLAGNPPALFVINKAATQGTEASNAADYIKAQGFSVCPAVLHLRAVHRHATNVGKIANEYDPDSKAAREVLQLYNYTVQFVESSRESHGKAKSAHARA